MNFEKKMEERRQLPDGWFNNCSARRVGGHPFRAAQRGCFDRGSFVQLVLDNNYGLPGGIAHSILLPSVLIALWLRLPM